MIALSFAHTPGCRGAELSQQGYALLTRQAALHWPELSPLPPIEREKNGKPFFHACPGHYFNLSHSGDWVVCVLSDRPVGVDLQQHKGPPPRVGKKFTPEEQALLLQDPGAFFSLWVKKEAFLKATGAGLTRPLNSFSVLPPEKNQVEGYEIRLLPPPAPGYSLAVAELTANH